MSAPTAEPLARFSLPPPPSSNNLYVPRRDGKGRAKTSEYDAWIKQALMCVLVARAAGEIPAAMEPLKHVRVDWRLPFSYARDIDNTKPLLDLLKRAGIIVDDRWVDENRQIRVPRVSPGQFVECSVWRTG